MADPNTPQTTTPRDGTMPGATDQWDGTQRDMDRGAAPVPTNPAGTPRDADNTRENRNDGAEGNLTPIDQSQSSEHIRTTAEIRRAVMDDDSLSSNAKNCKIITDRNGLVTLRGVVDSRAEIMAIEAHAQRVVGETNVVNQLEIDVD